MTALAEKLTAAGVKRDDMYLGAVEALRRSNGNVDAAIDLICKVVRQVAADMKSGRKASAGQSPSGTQVRGARETSESIGATTSALTRTPAAPVALRSIDRAARSAAFRAGFEVTKSVFDTFRVRNGLAIGDLRIDQVEKLEATNAVEARVLRSIRFHARLTDPKLKVRDVIKESTLKLFIEQAERSNDD